MVQLSYFRQAYTFRNRWPITQDTAHSNFCPGWFEQLKCEDRLELQSKSKDKARYNLMNYQCRGNSCNLEDFMCANGLRTTNNA